MTSVGTLSLYDMICAAQLADLIGSMTMEGLTGLLNAFDERVHAVRGHKGQMMVAKNFRLLTEGSEILKNCQSDRVAGCLFPALHSTGTWRNPRCNRICKRKSIHRAQRRYRQSTCFPGR